MSNMPENQMDRDISTTLFATCYDWTSISCLLKQLTDLTNMFLEAKDNMKFLTTLERHFKVCVVMDDGFIILE